jgi:hypothetical protein
VNLSQYDTLHIPKGIVHISNNAFREGESITSKIPSNITNFDFGASQVETIGSYAFIDAPFTNVLTLFDTIKTISYSAFIGSKISGIDLSRCHLLTTLQRETFADCDQVQTIIFNDNLRVISNPAGAGLGVFQGLKNFNGTLHLPSKLETIGAAAFSDLGIYSSTKVTLE